MRPIRNIDSTHPKPSPLPDTRSSQPSVAPSVRPSSIPSTAISSVMPGNSTHVHSALLSGVAGYVDAAGFASLIGLFPAHLTGEIVGDAIALSSGRSHATRLWILPIFVASVALATVVARTRRRSGQRALTGLLALVTSGLGLFSVSDFLARMLHESWHLHVFLGGACAVAAMGFQNALMRESLSGSCPTTVMTGNLTQVVIELVDHVLRKLTRSHYRDRRARSRLAPVAFALSAFVAGALLGGFLTRFLGSLSVLLPTALTATLTYRAWREDRRLLAPVALPNRMRPAALPQFEVWPDSLLPRAQAPRPKLDSDPKISLTVSLDVGKDSGRSTPDAERPAMKRTVSGTRLKTHIVSEEAKAEARAAGEARERRPK